MRNPKNLKENLAEGTLHAATSNVGTGDLLTQAETTKNSHMTLHNAYRYIQVAVAIIAAAAFTSCFDNTIHFQYKGTDINGWNRDDSISFSIRSLEESSYYFEEIGIRANTEYPYERLHLIVSQEVISTADTTRRQTITDKVSLPIYDEEGSPIGTGVNLRQYQIPLKTVKLQAGDSIQVSISHNMRDSVICGISDIGFKLEVRGER
ncbi:MAG: gliding motility lipoprotein GldH [Prevotella sp.]|nr:gliding motility lipoprotein GldH [Prevotella sp.]